LEVFLKVTFLFDFGGVFPMQATSNQNAVSNQIMVSSIIEKMTAGEKYLRVAPYIRCLETIIHPSTNQRAFCPCDGWKNPVLHSPAEPAPLKREDELLCAQCKHKVISHGNLLKLKPEQLDKLLAVVLQIEYCLQEAARTTDMLKRQKYMENVATLKQAIQSPFMMNKPQPNQGHPQQVMPGKKPMQMGVPNQALAQAQMLAKQLKPGQPGTVPMNPNQMMMNTVNPMNMLPPGTNPNMKIQKPLTMTGMPGNMHPGMPPVGIPGQGAVPIGMKKEPPDVIGQPPFEKPVITQIMKNFLQYKFSNLQEDKQKIAERITKLLLLGIQQQELPQPKFSTNIHEASVAERIYQLNYKRWLYYCKSNQSGAQYSPCEIFGRTILRSIVKDVRDTLTRKSVWGDDIREQYVNQYFLELEKELGNDLAQILREDFPQTFSAQRSRQQQAHQAAQHAAQQLQPPVEEGTPTHKRKSSTASGDINQVKKSKTEEIIVKPVLQNQLKTDIPYEVPPQTENPGLIPVPVGNPGDKTISVLLGPDTGIETKARDEKARQEERKGLLRAQVIMNDKDPQHMIWLATLKTIFAKQLPKMPKDYIVRLVFDRNHRSLCLLKNNNVVGGITFRPFKEQGFLEIAFCAIMSSEQVKGYGTHLMNHLKNHAQAIQIYHFLTYADNYAIGYFRKQGFTKTVQLPRKNFLGYIKDYDGGTIMECVVHKKINFLRVPEMIAIQRKALNDKIKEMSNSHVKHKGGLNALKDDRGIINIAEIPGIKESGWKPPQLSDDELTELQAELKETMVKLMTHDSSWPFHHPVDRSQVPDYYDIIKDPIDLEIVNKRVDSGNYYITREIFLSDLKRMCENCRTYNHPET